MDDRTKLLLKERELALERAEERIQKGKYKAAVKFFSIASDASLELGEDQASEDYLTKAQDLLDKLEENKRKGKKRKKN